MAQSNQIDRRRRPVVSVAPVNSELSLEQLDHYAGGLPDIGVNRMYETCPSCGVKVFDVEAGVAANCPQCGQTLTTAM